MNKDLISIIVPVYNVEQYLRQCIESLLQQDYKNIEIILVDDGSKDNSGSILDFYAKNDKRVKVIHKKNGGVSSARNIGIDYSNGEYIIFVDADDYLANDYVSYMLSIVENTGADFALSKNCFMSIGQKQINDDNIETLNSEQATALLISQRIVVGCWNKIYKKSLIIDNNIRFNENSFYGEGLQFITTVSQKAKKIGVGNKMVYYYRKNNSSSATTKFNIKKYVNGLESLDIIKKNLSIDSDLINKQLNYHYCLFYINALNDIISNKVKNQYNMYYKKWKRELHKYSKIVIKYDIVSLKGKIRIIIMNIFPSLIAFRDRKKRQHQFNDSI